MSGSFGRFAKEAKHDLKSVGAVDVFKGVVGARVVTGALSEVKNQIRSVADEFIAYDHAVTKAGARYGFERHSKEFDELAQSAREVGKSTKFMAAEAANGLDFFAKAAIKSTDAIKLIKPTAELAMAADLDIASAADIATDSLGAFQIEAGGFKHAADVLAFTANNTNTDLVEMFDTIKLAGPIVKMVGGEIESFSALVRPMASAGIKGSIAATTLKNAMLNLASGEGVAGKALKKLKVRVYDVVKGKRELRDMFDVLGDISKKLETKGSADRAVFMNQLFGKRAVAGMETVLKAGVDNLRKMREEARNAEGYTSQLAEKMGESYENKLKTVQSAFVEIGFKVIDQFGDKIPVAIDYFTNKLQKVDVKQVEKTVTKLIEDGKWLIKTFKDLMPIIKGIAIAWGAYRVQVAAIAAIDTARGIAFTIAKLKVLRSGIGSIIKKSGDVTPAMQKMADRSGKAVDTLGNRINAVAGIISAAMASLLAGYEAGKWLSENILEPHSQKVAEGNRSISEEANRKFRYRGGGAEEIYAEMKHAEDALIRHYDAGTFSAEMIAGSIMSVFTGEESPFSKQTKAELKLIAKRNTLKEMWEEQMDRERWAIEGQIDKTIETTKSIQSKLKELEAISGKAGGGRELIDISQKLDVNSTVNIPNAPAGTTAKSEVTLSAPMIDRRAMGQN